MKKLSVFIRVIVILLAVEIILQSAGLLLTYKSKELHSKKQNKKVILILGESTSDPNCCLKNKMTWSDYLSIDLAKGNYPFVIVNRAKAATTTSSILNSLPFWLEEYHPDIVISMIGINDSDEWILDLNKNFLSKIKIYRILTWCFYKIQSYFKYRPISPDFKLMRNKTEKLSTIKEAQINFNKSYELIPKIPPPRKSKDTYADLQKSLSYLELSMKDGVFVDGALERYSWIALELNEEKMCQRMIKKYISIGGVLKYTELMVSQYCFNKDDNEEGVLSQNEENLKLTKNTKGHFANYKNIHKMILKHGAIHIIMQYPLLSIKPLREVFSGSDNTFFIENKLNFEQELSKANYEKLFIDKFADNFGHTTDFGHQLIAKNVFNVLLNNRIIK